MAFSYKKYTDSDETKKYKQALEKLIKSQPTWNGGTYTTKLKDAENQIASRGKFTYNPNEDESYLQTKDLYVNQGKQAAADVVAQNAALTGGYGSSYGVSAGNQAYQSYLTQLASMIPQLKESARADYDAETERLNNLYSLYDAGYNREYGEYSDKLGQWNTDRDYTANMYTTGKSYDRSAYDSDRSLAQDNYQYETNLKYQKERDKVADEQWQKEYDLSSSKSSSSSSSSDTSDTLKKATETQYNKLLKAWKEDGYTNGSNVKEVALSLEYAGVDVEDLLNVIEEGFSKPAATPTTYSGFVKATGNSGIYTESEFNKSSNAVKKYGNYTKYLEAMYDKYK